MKPSEALQNIRINLKDVLEFPFNMTLEYKTLYELVKRDESQSIRLAKLEELVGLYKRQSYIRFVLYAENDLEITQEIMNEDELLSKKINLKEKELGELK